MVDEFLNELNKLPLYEVLSEASEASEVLRSDLNRRYLSDYLNIVYPSHNATEMQVTDCEMRTLPRYNFILILWTKTFFF